MHDIYLVFWEGPNEGSVDSCSAQFSWHRTEETQRVTSVPSYSGGMHKITSAPASVIFFISLMKQPEKVPTDIGVKDLWTRFRTRNAALLRCR